MQPKPRSKVKRTELKRLPLAPANRPSKKMKTEHALKVFMADHSSYAAAESNLPAQLKEKEEKIVEIKRKLHLLQRRNKKLLEKVTSLESMVGKYKDVRVQAQTPDMDILKQEKGLANKGGIFRGRESPGEDFNPTLSHFIVFFSLSNRTLVPYLDSVPDPYGSVTQGKRYGTVPTVCGMFVGH